MAAHGHTAAELIYKRADAEKPHMGMTSIKGSRPTKAKIMTAKNYLNEDEINILNRIVTTYLEFAELQALRKKPMYMKDWIEKLDDFLQITDNDILSHSEDILRQKPKQADVRKPTNEQKRQQVRPNSKEINGLYDLLNERESGGIIFTTIQKFTPDDEEMKALTDRENVIIIADEAHRTQYGLEARTDTKTGEVKYGYAKYLRDALPNASFIGFTGTPIDLEDRSTIATFGNYIDTYDMTRAVDDEATVKIYYENRVIKLDTDEEELEKIDEEFEEVTEGQEDFEREKNKAKWSRLESVVGSPNRVKILAKDIVNLYDEIIKIKPDWHSDDLDKGKIKVVMTGTAADNERLQNHIGGKIRRDILSKRMKNNNDELKIVIVRDIWLTGFVAVSIMLEKLEILQGIIHGFNYSNYMGDSQVERIRAITGGMDFILGKPGKEQKEFKQIAIELAKSHSLCAATEEGMEKSLEISYFKAVKASMSKLQERKPGRRSRKEVHARVNQMLQRSIISEEVIDVFHVMGLERPEVSILSEEFLEEVRGMKYKKLAVEIL